MKIGRPNCLSTAFPFCVVFWGSVLGPIIFTLYHTWGQFHLYNPIPIRLIPFQFRLRYQIQVIAPLLNASPRSQVGVGRNRSARRWSVFARWAFLLSGYCSISKHTFTMWLAPCGFSFCHSVQCFLSFAWTLNPPNVHFHPMRSLETVPNSAGM